MRAVHDAAQHFVERARRGDGPAFLQCDTYRYHGHHVGDINSEYYRSKQEEQAWKGDRDPIAMHRAWLVEQKCVDTGTLDRMYSEVESEMKKAVQFAMNGAYPDVSEVEQDVYA